MSEELCNDLGVHRRGTVTLREYLEKIIDLRFKSIDDGTVLARNTMEARLEKLNELRSEVVRDRGEYVRRDVHSREIEAMNNRLSSLENFRAKSIGVAAVLVLFSGTIGAVVARAFGA